MSEVEEEDSEVDVVHFETLFDGEVHWLTPGEDWILPYVKHEAFVPLEVQISGDRDPETGLLVPDKIDGPDLGAVTVEDPFGERLYMTEGGWSALSLHLQMMGEALGGRMVCEQLVKRDPKTWEVLETWHKVQFVGKGDYLEDFGEGDNPNVKTVLSDPAPEVPNL